MKHDKNRHLKLVAQLRNERSTFESHWRELAEFVLPRRGRWTPDDRNRGDKRNGRIIDNTATLAARTLRAGMHGGITSPARPWFRLTTPDPALAEYGTVKRWLDEVTSRLLMIFNRSNLYNVLPIVYGDMGVFGSSAMIALEDDEDVMRFAAFPLGSYCFWRRQCGGHCQYFCHRASASE